MPDYGRYCPVSIGSEVLADRWTPLIMRELLLGYTRFNDLVRGLPGISRSLLAQRLKHLERVGVLDRWPSPAGHGSEYLLTPAGRDLEQVIMAIGRWAVRWRFEEYRNDDVDAPTLMWWMHRYVDASRLPPVRVVVQFDHVAPARRTVWMVLDRGEASVCLQHPGFDPDLVVTAATPALAQVFSGADTWRGAIARGDVQVAGPPRLERGLADWFQPHVFAPEIDAAVAATR